MKDMYVYILECADDSFYVGVTNDVGRRFIEHVKGLHELAKCKNETSHEVHNESG